MMGANPINMPVIHFMTNVTQSKKIAIQFMKRFVQFKKRVA